MAHWTRQNCLALSLGTAALLCVLPGCGDADLSGYRPASEHAARTDAAKTPSPTEKEPVIASPQTTQPHTSQDVLLPDSQAIPTQTPNEADFLPVSALVPVNIVDGTNVRALMSIPATDPRQDSKSTNSDNPLAVGEKDASAVSEPRKIEVLVKEKTFRTEPKTGALRVTYDDLDLLKILNMDPVTENAVELMPAWLQGLNGKTIRLRGVMFPTFDAEGLDRFVLARDSQTCCFGPDAKIYDLIEVTMKEGTTTHYIHYTRFIEVVGKLRIEISGRDGKLFGLYFIDDAKVIER